jgi:chorismate dehydratase
LAGLPQRFRIGGVPFGVGAPLLHGLDAEPGVDLVRAVPTDLIPSLRDGSIDAALVSSIEGFRRPGYAAVAGVGICCHGPVQSVRAFRRRGRPIRTVGLTHESESSVALLRALLRGPLGADSDLRFERVRSTRSPDALPHDLVLLIGDDGLHADPGDREPIDLGTAWLDWTGLPFVFALWLIRPGVDAETLSTILVRARESARSLPRSRDEGGVHYDIGPAEREGLARFAREAQTLGLIEPDCSPRFVAVPSAPPPPGRASCRGSD